MNILKQTEIKKQSIEQLKTECDEVYSQLTSTTRSMLDSPSSVSFDQHKFDRFAIAHEKLEKAINEWLTLLKCAFRWVYDCPELSSLERIIILRHYFCGCTFKEIANSIDYSVHHCMRINKKILAIAPDTNTVMNEERDYI